MQSPLSNGFLDGGPLASSLSTPRWSQLPRHAPQDSQGQASGAMNSTGPAPTTLRHTSAQLASGVQAPSQALDINKTLKEALRHVKCTWDDCDASCASASLFELHLLRRHVDLSKKRTGASTSARPVQPVLCEIRGCSFKSDDSNGLATHVVQQHVEILLKRCPVANCGHTSGTIQAVIVHLRTQHRTDVKDLPNSNPTRPRLREPPPLPAGQVPTWTLATPRVSSHAAPRPVRERSLSSIDTPLRSGRSSVGLVTRGLRAQSQAVPSAVNPEEDNKNWEYEEVSSYRGGWMAFEDDLEDGQPAPRRNRHVKLDEPSVGTSFDPMEFVDYERPNTKLRPPSPPRDACIVRRVPEVVGMPVSHGVSDLPIPPPSAVPRLPPEEVIPPLAIRSDDLPAHTMLFPAFKAEFLRSHPRAGEYDHEEPDDPGGFGDPEKSEDSDGGMPPTLAQRGRKLFSHSVLTSASTSTSRQDSASASRDGSVLRHKRGKKRKSRVSSQGP